MNPVFRTLTPTPSELRIDLDVEPGDTNSEMMYHNYKPSRLRTHSMRYRLNGRKSQSQPRPKSHVQRAPGMLAKINSTK